MKRFPSLQSTIAAAAYEALERFRDEGKKTVIRLVDMEASYLTVEFFRKLPQEVERAANLGGNSRGNRRENTPQDNSGANPRGNSRENPARENPGLEVSIDRLSEGHFRRIGSNVMSYVNMVSDTLRITIPKAVVFCQVKEAKQNLLNVFYVQIGKKEVQTRFFFFQRTINLFHRSLGDILTYVSYFWCYLVVFRVSNWVTCWMKIQH